MKVVYLARCAGSGVDFAVRLPHLSFAYRILLVVISLRLCLCFRVLGSRVGVRFGRDLGVEKVARAPRGQRAVSSKFGDQLWRAPHLFVLSHNQQVFLTTLLFFFSAMILFFLSDKVQPVKRGACFLHAAMSYGVLKT